MTSRASAAVVLSAIVAVGTAAWAAPAPLSTTSRTKRFALVVGNNAPAGTSTSSLRYADDDAVKWAVLLRTFGTEVELLTDLDAESARLYGADAPRHQRPSRKELDAAMARLGADMKRARANGLRTVFFFVYAGHGDVDDHEGYLGLTDGPFYRHDLERSVLAVSPADTNHVIIDACRSVFLAYDRGPGGRRRPWPQPYFTASAAARFPNTGFLLADSSGGASHEWEEFQAGIFSHEVRSGLLGGADADGDGQITYKELAAFVRVANQAVRNDWFRPKMLAHPPDSGDGVLVRLPDALVGRVRLGAGRTGRHVLEDSLGVRWADVHPGPTQEVTLLLPDNGSKESKEGSDGNANFFLRAEDGNVEYPLRRGDDVALATLSPKPSGVLRRGALHEAFTLLFAAPFDESALSASSSGGADDLDLSTTERTEPDVPRRRLKPLALALAGGSLAGFAASGVLFWSAERLRSASTGASGSARPEINAEIDSRNRWSAAAAITGAVLAAVATALYVLGRRGQDADASSAP